MASATSSKVDVQPPPLPTRRYSMFQVAQPGRGQLGGERPSEIEPVALPPEPAVDHHDHAADRCAGRRQGQLAELAGVGAVREPGTRDQARHGGGTGCRAAVGVGGHHRGVGSAG